MAVTPMRLAGLAEELAREVTKAAGKLQNLADLADNLEAIGKPGKPDLVYVAKEIREILND